mgnify:CR=1 FL=1
MELLLVIATFVGVWALCRALVYVLQGVAWAVWGGILAVSRLTGIPIVDQTDVGEPDS